MALDRLVLVYDADGGLLGELRYLGGKLVGTAHCALCDITHGLTGEKRAWRACREELGVPVVALHRNELDGAQRAAAEGQLPCVLADEGGSYRVLVSAETLEGCGGDVDRLAEALRAASGGD